MEENLQNNNDASTLEVTSSLTFETTEDKRLVTILYKKVEEMEKQIYDLTTKKIIDETQIPPEILANSGLLPSSPRKTKKGRGYRPILQSEIIEAKKQSPFAAAQARWLGIGIRTYRKYAEKYGLYEPKPNEKGKRNIYDPQRGRYPLVKILANQYRDNLAVSDWIVKDKLIRSGTLLPKCNICHYDKRRITDGKIALILDHMDGDKRNFSIENLQLLCLNCTFECGRGYIRKGNHMFDPDWMQGAQINQVDPIKRW